ncbi:terminase small subunit [Pseudomonas sp. HMWF031]|nr:terminase small subunit [Pseudomonas sp. HMWF031]
MTVISKTEFAARRGWAKSYVSKLANQNRLVLTKDGKIELEATEALLDQTADPSKAAVADRHHQDRLQRDVYSQLSSHVEPTSMAAPLPSITPAVALPDFQKARALREHNLAQLAEIELHKAKGSLVSVIAVQTGAYNAGRMLRDQLLGMPPQLAPELASMTDPWEIEKHLTAAIRRSLEDAERISSADLEHTLTPS